MVVEHIISKEHQTRSMLDGQIHHVEEVVQIVRELVHAMQEATGRELKENSGSGSRKVFRNC